MNSEEKIKGTSMIRAVYFGISSIYNFQYNYAPALKYEPKAYQMAKDTSVTMVLSPNKINSYNTFNYPNLLPFIDSTFQNYKTWSEKNLIKN
ncbi:hypothetical protein [Lacihabitans sp. CS3-21]|uniref:hypothetical protein n=1 Tax=Lacihabitans sp. CS3-21 TaxID=2487332 RepID=UPI0020CBC417|nr:hypothetical protein [Lacihabitans sp. CS3-21]